MLTKTRLTELYTLTDSGNLIPKRPRQGSPSRDGMAGYTHHSGYRYVSVDNKVYGVHQLVFLLDRGYLPKKDIDHINGNKLDNRPENLREVIRSHNAQNTLKTSAKSGLKGAYKVGNQRYRSSIRVEDKTLHLGYFGTKEEAYEAYLKAKLSMHPGFNSELLSGVNLHATPKSENEDD